MSTYTLRSVNDPSYCGSHYAILDGTVRTDFCDKLATGDDLRKLLAEGHTIVVEPWTDFLEGEDIADWTVGLQEAYATTRRYFMPDEMWLAGWSDAMLAKVDMSDHIA